MTPMFPIATNQRHSIPSISKAQKLYYLFSLKFSIYSEKKWSTNLFQLFCHIF